MSDEYDSMNTPKRVLDSRDHGPRFPPWMWICAALLLLFSIVSSLKLRRAQRQLAGLQSRLTAQEMTHQTLEKEITLAQQARTLVTDPASVRFTLNARHKSAPALHAFWHPKLGILIYGERVPDPADGHFFQVWLIAKDQTSQALRSSIFLPDATRKVTLLIPHPSAFINSMATLAISEEIAESSNDPTSEFIWRGDIPP